MLSPATTFNPTTMSTLIAAGLRRGKAVLLRTQDAAAAHDAETSAEFVKQYRAAASLIVGFAAIADQTKGRWKLEVQEASITNHAVTDHMLEQITLRDAESNRYITLSEIRKDGSIGSVHANDRKAADNMNALRLVVGRDLLIGEVAAFVGESAAGIGEPTRKERAAQETRMKELGKALLLRDLPTIHTALRNNRIAVSRSVRDHTWD